MSEVNSFPECENLEGRMRQICRGEAGLPLNGPNSTNNYRTKLLGLQPLYGGSVIGSSQIVRPAVRQSAFSEHNEKTREQAYPCIHRFHQVRSDESNLCGSKGDQVNIFHCAGGHGECSLTKYCTKQTVKYCSGCKDRSSPIIPVEEWWKEPATQERYRRVATEFIETIPTVDPSLSGQGIVITGGGKYFVSAYVTIRVLRKVGCDLPIELWCLDGEMDDEMISLVAPFGVTVHNAQEHARDSGYFIEHWWKGWQLKAYALRHSSFAEVLMLDADSYPARDPSFLFEWKGYIDTGAIFWPDVGTEAQRPFEQNRRDAFGVPTFTEIQAESGQLVMNKVRNWREVNLALHYNQMASYSYRIIYGDKDTFPVAFHRLGTKYSRMWPVLTHQMPALLQLDDHGEVLFYHRIDDKFSIPGTKFESMVARGARKRMAVNKHVRGWHNEQFCHDCIAELKSKWTQTK